MDGVFLIVGFVLGAAAASIMAWRLHWSCADEMDGWRLLAQRFKAEGEKGTFYFF